MTPTIVLTGKTGQVGYELQALLAEMGKVVAPGRSQLDLADPTSIRGMIRETRPEIFVNAGAYTAVDAAEGDEASARAINADGVAVIAEEMKKIGGGVIHYSTDYVFDGSKKAAYVETDAPNPVNVYGKTKLAGEEALRGSGVAHLILRTSWVYATRGKNFLLTILRLATEKEELRVVTDQIGAPTCARDIAEATARVLEDVLQRRGSLELSGVSGTYHASAAGETTWYEFARAIVEQAKSAPRDLPWLAEATKGRAMAVQRVVPVSTQEYGSGTRRPAYSVLCNGRLAQTFGVRLPHWRDGLTALFAADSGRSGQAA